MRVLLVEDDEVDALSVRRALKSAGLDVHIEEASDFESAKRALLQKKQVALVLLDFSLPGGDGRALLEVAREAGFEEPIIVLTGQGDELLAVELLKAGAADYLPKSQLSAERLAQSIRQVLRVRSAEKDARAAQGALERQVTMLNRLLDFGVSIHAAPTASDTLTRVAHLARELLGARLAVARFSPLEASGAPAEVRAQLLDESAAPPWSPLPIESELLDGARCLRRAKSDQSPGVLAAPLLDQQGKRVGSLQLVGPSDGDFSAADELLLAQLAQTASVALEKSRLFREAKMATRARDDVLAIVSHDLRHPLNTVGVSATLLRKSLEEEAPLALVQRIERGVAQMNRMIQDLLDAACIDSGMLSVAPAPSFAAALLAEAVEAATPLAEAAQVHVDASNEVETLQVNADRDRIAQVFSNLIGNALRFTPSRSGRVTLSVAREGERARFEVRDNGHGVDPKHLPHLFERYWKDAEASRDGAGLGLFIARGIVLAHGGTIKLESELGQGTAVRFWLPLQEPVRASDAASSL